MTSIHAKAFRPKVPALSPRLLQGNYAVEALACKLESGAMDPFKGKGLVRTSTADVLSMHRFRHNGQDYWFEWPVACVDVARSPNSQDSRNRAYWSGDGEPRMASAAQALSGGGPYPTAWYVLGVYIPATIGTITPTGGSGNNESRAYVDTLVTQYGEEGAPSLPKVVTGPINSTSWNLSGLDAPPPNSGTVSAAAYQGDGVTRVTMDTTRGLARYEQVTFGGISGMTDLNATLTIRAVVDATHLDVELTTAQTLTGGGTWARRAPHNTTGMKRRIYRTVGTNTDYKFVAEQDASLTTYNDAVPATGLGAAIPTLNSYTPPKNGHSMTELANGSHCLLAGNEICFSEIGKPHSWPIENRYSFSGQGVSATAVGNNVVVGTDSAPVIAVATRPEAAQVAKLEGDALPPNIAKCGTVDTGKGALFPSHDGLWHVTPGGAVNVTAKLYTAEQWQALKPATFKACYVDQDYWAMHGSDDGAGRLLLLDTTNPDGIVEVADQFDALYTNHYDGRMYVARGNKIYLWDADDTNRYLAVWRGPDVQLGRPTNFVWCQVHAEFGQIVPLDLSIQQANEALMADARNVLGALAVTPVLAVPLGGSNIMEQPAQTQRRVQFTLLNNAEVRFTREVTSSKPFKLPGGFKSEVQGVQVSASTRVHSVTIAESIEELKQVSV